MLTRTGTSVGPPGCGEMRITIVTNMPTPYRTGLYEALDRRLKSVGGRLSVVYGTRRDPTRQWPEFYPGLTGTVDSVFVPRARVDIRGHSTYVNPLVVRYLSRTRPDVVVLGGFAPWIYPAALWCRGTKTPFLSWSGETLATARLHRDRERWRRPIWRLASGHLAYGPAVREYLLAAGVREPDITVVGNGLDIDGYARAVEEARVNRSATRRRLGVTGPVVLSVGGKNLDLVVTCARRHGPPAAVVVAGSERTGRIAPSVVGLGRLEPQEMPAIYGAADCMAHIPLQDHWPHAINEALSGGLPVVASRDTGVPEEVLSGPGCSVVDAEPDVVVAALERAIAVAEATSEEVREAIRAPLRPYDVDRMADRMYRAAEHARSGA